MSKQNMCDLDLLESKGTCSICLEFYTGRKPKLLPCFHTFCMECLSDLAKVSASRSGEGATCASITCPACRQVIPVPPGGVGSFQINPADRFHLMPIITPAYPQQNSTYNVSNSTRSVITEEFKEGLDVVTRIYEQREEWSALFEPSNFFHKYKHYIVLRASAEEIEHYIEWKGYVESKIRLLVGNLERNPYIKLAHVMPESYGPINESEGQYMCKWFIGLVFHNTQTSNIDLTYDIQSFSDAVHKQAMHINLFKEGMNVEITYLRRKQLSNYVPKHILDIGRPEKKKGSRSSGAAGDRRPSLDKQAASGSKADQPADAAAAGAAEAAAKNEEDETSQESQSAEVSVSMPSTSGGASAEQADSMVWHPSDNSSSNAVPASDNGSGTERAARKDSSEVSASSSGDGATCASITCPACRQVIPVPPGGVGDFQSNFYIDQDTAMDGRHSPCQLCDGREEAIYQCGRCGQFCDRCHRVHSKCCSAPVTSLVGEVEVIDAATRVLQNNLKEVHHQRQEIEVQVQARCDEGSLRGEGEASGSPQSFRSLMQKVEALTQKTLSLEMNMEQKNSSLEQKNSSLEQEISSLKKKTSSLEKKMEQKTSYLKKMEQKNSSLEQKNSSLEQEISSLKKTSSLEKKMEQKTSYLKKMEQENSFLEQNSSIEHIALKKFHQNLSLVLQYLGEVKDKVRQLDSIQQETSDNSKELKDTVSQLKDLQTSTRDLQTSSRAHDLALADVNTHLAKFKTQVAFQVFLNANLKVRTKQVLILSDEIVNMGKCYNTDTGYFTAPVSGGYLFTATATNADLGKFVQLEIVHEGRDIAYLASEEDNCTCYVTIWVEQGHRVWLRTFEPQEEDEFHHFDSGWKTSFSGVLVHPDF